MEIRGKSGTGAPPPLPINRIIVVFTLLFLIAFQASARDITVRIIDAKSGKPFSGIRVAISTWNGTFNIHKPPLPPKHVDVSSTNSKGIAIFHLPNPLPDHMGFDIGGLRDFAGCWTLPDVSSEAVIRFGVVAEYNKAKCGGAAISVSAKPGEITIMDNKLSLPERMRQEFP